MVCPSAWVAAVTVAVATVAAVVEMHGFAAASAAVVKPPAMHSARLELQPQPPAVQFAAQEAEAQSSATADAAAAAQRPERGEGVS